MGDLSIAQDLLEGVADALGDLGATRTLRLVSVPVLDINNPGEARTGTFDDEDLEALLFDFEEEYMPGSSIHDGATLTILSIIDLSDAQVALVKPGNRLIDGSRKYEITKTNPIEAAGVTVTIIIQLKG